MPITWAFLGVQSERPARTRHLCSEPRKPPAVFKPGLNWAHNLVARHGLLLWHLLPFLRRGSPLPTNHFSGAGPRQRLPATRWSWPCVPPLTFLLGIEGRVLSFSVAFEGGTRVIWFLWFPSEMARGSQGKCWAEGLRCLSLRHQQQLGRLDAEGAWAPGGRRREERTKPQTGCYGDGFPSKRRSWGCQWALTLRKKRYVGTDIRVMSDLYVGGRAWTVAVPGTIPWV